MVKRFSRLDRGKWRSNEHLLYCDASFQSSGNNNNNNSDIWVKDIQPLTSVVSKDSCKHTRGQKKKVAKKRGRRNDAPIMSSANCTSLWRQCYGLGLLQSIKSGFSALNSTYSIFSSLMVQAYCKTLFARVHRTQTVKEWFRDNKISFSHMDWPLRSPDLNPVENLWDVLEKALRSGQTPIQDLNATLNRNKSFDLVLAHWKHRKCD